MKYQKISAIVGVVLILTFFTSCSFFTKDCDSRLNASIINTYGNMEGVKEAVQEGADVNRIIGHDQTRFDSSDHNPVGIMLCINGGIYDISEYLIEHGSNPNYMGNLGETFLMDTAGCYNLDFCDFLLKHGAKINTIGEKDYKGYTALDCVFLGDLKTYPDSYCIKTFNFLTQHGAKVTQNTLQAAMAGDGRGYHCYSLIQTTLKDLLKANQKSGLNPLVEAAIMGDENRIKKSLYSSNLDSRNKEKVLLYTAAFGTIDTMDFLLQKGFNINTIDSQGMNLLAIASKYNNVDMTRFLYEKGISPDAKDSDGDNALTQAIFTDKIDNAKYLLSKGTKFQNFNTDYSSSRLDVDVLQIAAMNGNLSTIKFILQNGYTLNKYNEFNAMYMAINNNRINVVQYFINIGISANTEDEDQSLLTLACESCNIDIVKLLVDHGADVNGGTDKGSALRTAAQYRKLDIAKYLIDKGADVNAIYIESDGSRPYSILSTAIESGSLEIVKLLVEHGANINYKDPQENNETALQIANGLSSKNIYDYLSHNNHK